MEELNEAIYAVTSLLCRVQRHMTRQTSSEQPLERK